MTRNFEISPKFIFLRRNIRLAKIRLLYLKKIRFYQNCCMQKQPILYYLNMCDLWSIRLNGLSCWCMSTVLANNNWEFVRVRSVLEQAIKTASNSIWSVTGKYYYWKYCSLVHILIIIRFFFFGFWSDLAQWHFWQIFIYRFCFFYSIKYFLYILDRFCSCNLKWKIHNNFWW